MGRLYKPPVGDAPVLIGGVTGTPAQAARTGLVEYYAGRARWYAPWYLFTSGPSAGVMTQFPDDMPWYFTTPEGVETLGILFRRVFIEHAVTPGVESYDVYDIYLSGYVTIPATAGTPTIPGYIDPEQLRLYMNAGWNSSARSIGTISPGQYLEFTVLGSTNSAMMLLSYYGYDGVFGTAATNQGFIVDETGIYLLDSGGVTTAFGGLTPTTIFYIYRLVDGRLAFRVGSIIHINAQVLDRFSPLYAYGMLYQAFDEIPSAEIKTGTLSFPEAAFSGVGSLVASIGPTAVLSGIGTIIPEKKPNATLTGVSNLYAEQDFLTKGNGTLPIFIGVGADYEYGVGDASMPVFYSIPFLDPYGWGALPYFTGDALGSDHDVGQAASLLPLFLGIGTDYEYGFGEGILPLITSNGSGGFVPNGTMIMFDILTAGSSFTPITDIVMFLSSNGTLSSTYSMTRAQALELLSSLSGSSTYTVSGTYLASLLSGLSGVSAQSLSINSLPDLQDSGVVWVVNMNTQASGQYEQYGFNSFFERSGAFYGVAGNGIYKLEGATDSGAAIKALADLGRSNFGVTERKSVPDVYIGVSSTAKMVLKVISDGGTYYYEAQGNSTDMQNQRFILGKGLRAAYWQLVVENSDGCDFSLASIEFKPIRLSRRI